MDDKKDIEEPAPQVEAGDIEASAPREEVGDIEESAPQEDGGANTQGGDGSPTTLTLAAMAEKTASTETSVSTPVMVPAPTPTPALQDSSGDGSVDAEKGKFDRSESGLDHHADPFAQRAGKTLIWSKVNMVLTGQGDKPFRKILDNVWGEVPPKETTAIMGPSGAGKTSLLNILAGRSTSRGPISVSADVRLNNYRVDPTNINVRRSIAFVAQDDSLQIASTPRESIRFSAKLRLPRSTTDHELDKLVDRMITELGLTICADTIVGGERLQGISGGERKRTSVGVELVVKPSMVFLDEPTSGLDSFSAVQLCQVLKKVANAGASVLFTIHQPSSEIFNSFDHLILLNKGRVMYQGPVTEVPQFFGDRGHPNPPNYNPADWIMMVAQAFSEETLDEEGFFPVDERELGDPFDPEDGEDPLALSVTGRATKGGNGEGEDRGQAVKDLRQPGFSTQTTMLTDRELINLRRNKVAFIARMFLTIFMSTLVGVIFLDVGNTASNVPLNLQSHFGALIMCLMLGMFGTAQPSLLAFPEERPVFLREYSTNHYSVVSYFISRFVIEASVTAIQILVLCVITYFLIDFQMGFVMFFVTIYSLAMASTALSVFFGCSVEDPKLAIEFLPLVFVPQLLFSGFFVVPDLIPVWLRWARYLCTLTYAVRIILVEEFENCGDNLSDEVDERCSASGNATIPPDVNCESPRDEANMRCDELLENIEADPDETWWNWLVMVGLFVAFRFVGLTVLTKKALKFY